MLMIEGTVNSKGVISQTFRCRLSAFSKGWELFPYTASVNASRDLNTTLEDGINAGQSFLEASETMQTGPMHEYRHLGAMDSEGRFALFNSLTFIFRDAEIPWPFPIRKNEENNDHGFLISRYRYIWKDDDETSLIIAFQDIQPD